MGELGPVDTWKAVLGQLELQVTRPIYETWLKDTHGLSLTDDLMSVGVPAPFAVEWLERRMHQLIHRTVQRVTGQPKEIRFQVDGAGAHDTNNQINNGSHQRATVSCQRWVSSINAKYTFDNFVVGPCNRLAYSAARAICESIGRSYNPLFIYSGVGLGKTHLLNAIGHTCVARGVSFIYATCEQFTNEFVAAIRSRTNEEFRNKYRGVDVLMIDDVQFIRGKEQTQEDFFHTINDLHSSNRQVVLTSDRPPKAMSLLEDRLRSRFEWGLIADIQPPDLETRVAILRTKAEQMGLVVEDTIIEYVAKKVQKNVRDLEGSLNHIEALAQFTNNPVTLDLTARAISDYMPDRCRTSEDTEKIVAEVARGFRVSTEAILGTSRKKEIVTARHVAMYLLSEELDMRDTDIGRLLGGRDHSTVISAVARVTYRINVDSQLRQTVLDLKEALFA